MIVEQVTKINSIINSYVWGIPMLVLIIFTGIMMTIRTKFFQVSHAKHVGDETFFAIFKKRHVTKTKEKSAISQFQALTTALAATIGTGNIAGVATALTIGGPGAIFWMWLSAFFGMMTNYSENVLGIFYRRKNPKGEWSGGAMYYLRDGLGSKKHMKGIAKFLAVLFAIFCVMASFGIGNMTQINSIADAMHTNFSVPTIITGIILAVIAALVIVGGIKRIGSVTEKLVPFMALAYMLGAIIIFVCNYRQIPYVFGSIFSDAFNFSAVGGGIGGYVIKRAATMGFKRGVFSNEAGLGSSVMVHSASDVKEPVIQGMWGIFEVFFDTIIVCTLTSFVLLSSTIDAKELVKNTDNGECIEISSDKDTYSIAGNGKDVHLVDKEYNLVPIKLDDNGKTELLKNLPEGASEDDYIEVSYKGNTYYAEKMTEKDATEDDYVYSNIVSISVDSEKADDGNIQITVSQINGVSLVSYAFSETFGKFAGKFLAIAILLFAFSTVLGWSFYGTKAMEFLGGLKATMVYKVIFVCFIVVGATLNLGLAWDIADTLNGLMAIPNLIAVIALSGTVVKITRNYVSRILKKEPENVKPMLSAFEDIQEEHEKIVLAQAAEKQAEEI